MKRFILSLLVSAFLSPAMAADNMFPTPGNALAPGMVNMCPNAAGTTYQPCSPTSPLSVSILGGGSGYGSTATPLTGNAAGSTAAVVGTLGAAAGLTTYICGFNVQAIGGTATVGPITIAGLTGSSQVYQTDVNSATVGKQVAAANFSPCIPASAANTAITVSSTANGTATAVNVNSWGFRQ